MKGKIEFQKWFGDGCKDLSSSMMLMQRADEEQLLRISVMKTAGVGRPRWPTAEEA